MARPACLVLLAPTRVMPSRSNGATGLMLRMLSFLNPASPFHHVWGAEVVLRRVKHVFGLQKHLEREILTPKSLRQPGSIDPSHKGPCAVYMKKVDNSAASDNAAGNGWFKIMEDGYDSTAGKWCTEKLIPNDGHLAATIPDDLAAGYYLVRPELLALHQADKTPPDPQFYVGCAQIFLSSSGSAVPRTLSFLIHYSPLSSCFGGRSPSPPRETCPGFQKHPEREVLTPKSLSKHRVNTRICQYEHASHDLQHLRSAYEAAIP